jgi:hypothetical protein
MMTLGGFAPQRTIQTAVGKADRMEEEKPSRKISRDSIQFGLFLAALGIPVYLYSRNGMVASFFVVIGTIWILAGYMGRYLAEGGGGDKPEGGKS